MKGRASVEAQQNPEIIEDQEIQVKPLRRPMTRMRHVVSLIINIAAIVLTACSIGSFFFAPAGVGIIQVTGWSLFMFFTNDSAILAAICCAIVAYFNIQALRGGKLEFKPWVLQLKAIGTAAVSLTFLTVLCFLGPSMGGWAAFYVGPNLYLHGICPLLSIVSYVFVERGYVSVKRALWAFAPVILYGIVYCIEVMVIGYQNGGWFDFYGFTRGGMWLISIIAMGVATLAIVLLERIPHSRKFVYFE